jgi:hypothetical protein
VQDLLQPQEVPRPLDDRIEAVVQAGGSQQRDDDEATSIASSESGRGQTRRECSITNSQTTMVAVAACCT